MEPGYIAFFDSGIGGLTLLKECAQQLAGESFLYFGDNANAPYGNKSPEEIERLTLTAFGYLSRFPLIAAVLACNTVTAECAAALRARCPFPVLGVEPALKPAAKACKNVLVLATRATLSSKKFRALAESVSGACRFTFYCPRDLAGEIENNIFDLSKVDLSRHLPEGEQHFDGAVLGCTHYIFLKEQIAARLRCPVFDGNAGTADHLSKILGKIGQKEKSGYGGLSINTVKQEESLFDKMAINGDFCRKNAVFFVGNAAFKNKTVFFARL